MDHGVSLPSQLLDRNQMPHSYLCEAFAGIKGLFDPMLEELPRARTQTWSAWLTVERQP